MYVINHCKKYYYISVEAENILVYIGGYICPKVSRSVCDECKQALIGNFDINN